MPDPYTLDEILDELQEHLGKKLPQGMCERCANRPDITEENCTCWRYVNEVPFNWPTISRVISYWGIPDYDLVKYRSDESVRRYSELLNQKEDDKKVIHMLHGRCGGFQEIMVSFTQQVLKGPKGGELGRFLANLDSWEKETIFYSMHDGGLLLWLLRCRKESRDRKFLYMQICAEAFIRQLETKFSDRTRVRANYDIKSMCCASCDVEDLIEGRAFESPMSIGCRSVKLFRLFLRNAVLVPAYQEKICLVLLVIYGYRMINRNSPLACISPDLVKYIVEPFDLDYKHNDAVGPRSRQCSTGLPFLEEDSLRRILESHSPGPMQFPPMEHLVPQ
jgi:hypothetical protein